MNGKAFTAILFLLAASICQPLLAQHKPSIHAPQQGLNVNLTSHDPLTSFSYLETESGRIDAVTGIARALYRLPAISGLNGSPVEIANTLLQQEESRLGIAEIREDLEPISIIEGRYSSHVTYQQTHRGLPVYNRMIKVNLDRNGQPTMVLNGIASHISNSTSLPTTPGITAQHALDQAASLLNQADVRASVPELIIYPDMPPRLAWRIITWPEEPAIEVELLIDALTGSLIKAQNLSTHAKAFVTRYNGLQKTNASHLTHTGLVIGSFQSSSPRSRATGSGFVFDPDPLTTSGALYGAPYVDNEDIDIPEVNAQRVEVDLLDIEQNNDGQYHLTGPYVQIVSESSSGSSIYQPPVEPTPDAFRYTRSNDFFEAVNAYYHIDKSQRYLQSLDVGREIQSLSLPVNPHGLGLEDNSRYYSFQNFIAFGTGGVDDAEDAHVIWHEYGHALLEGSAPGLLASTEGAALHEGWGDYWAGSYTRHLAEEGIGPREDWRSLFKWDSGDGSIWPGREMAFTGKYPDDTFCDNGGFQCDIYADGMLYATTLMLIYDAFGRTVADRLSLASHGYLMHPVTFRDATEAILQADADLYGGEHFDFLVQTFNERGLIDLSTFGPFVVHTPLPTTEQLGGTISVSLEATAVSAPIERTVLVYTHQDEPADTLQFQPDSGNTFTGALPLPSQPGVVDYFIEVTDELGLGVRLPPGNNTFSFDVGPDNEPPEIQHTELNTASLTEWPVLLTSIVNDNLGVDTVIVSYMVDGPLGNLLSEGTFGLNPNGNQYTGIFPVAVEALEPGSTVSYSFLAKDRALAANERRLPEAGFFTLNIIIDNGVFRKYDFENDIQIVSGSGSWQRDKPAFGLRTAFTDNFTWATNPSSQYPATPGLSSLALPPMNLRGLDEAFLVFWQWYDTEHDGTAFPEGPIETTLWDGGNIKYSIDDGATWRILQPNGGYNGTLAAGRENPLGGEPAFGGYSYGWRQVIAPLPVDGPVLIRFDFGTDNGNEAEALTFAGWHLDDISILTFLPEDTSIPAATLLPPVAAVRDPGQMLPEAFIEASDDTGIAHAVIDYQTFFGGMNAEGQFRLSMDSVQTGLFYGTFPVDATTLSVGDSLTYRVTLTDFSGNSITYPRPGDPSYRIEYRLRDRIDLLTDAVPSGNWRQEDESWTISALDSDSKLLSSLVFEPLDLPENVDNLQFILFYQHELLSTHGGNIKISTDNAATWQVLRPVDGYNSSFADNPDIENPLRNQDIFTGSRPALQQAMFDLLDHKGQQIRLRVDFAAPSELAPQEFWKIQEATIAYSTLKTVDGGFFIPRQFSLHENYPDPFSGTTTLGYTIPEATSVKLEVYDILGRRVALLVDREQAAGSYTLTFDGSDLASGLYLLRMETDSALQIERMIVME